MLPNNVHIMAFKILKIDNIVKIADFNYFKFPVILIVEVGKVTSLQSL